MSIAAAGHRCYCADCWYNMFPDHARIPSTPCDYSPTTPPPNSPNFLCDEDLEVVNIVARPQQRMERKRELTRQRQETAKDELKRVDRRLPLRRSAVQAMIAMGTMPPVTTREQQLQKEKDMEGAGEDQGMEV